MSRQGDREASNALVQNTNFYASALGRAHAEHEQHERIIDLLRVDAQKREADLHTARLEGDNLRRVNEELHQRVKSLEETARFDKKKHTDAASEIARLNAKIDAQDKNHATVQRALVESHHERDGLRTRLHESGEALGFLKGNANAFVRDLRKILEGAGYTCETPDDMTEATRDLASRAGPSPAPKNVRKPPLRLPG